MLSPIPLVRRSDEGAKQTDFMKNIDGVYGQISRYSELVNRISVACGPLPSSAIILVLV